MLKSLSYLCIYLLIVIYSDGRMAQRGYEKRLLRIALIAGVLVAGVAIAGWIIPNGKVLWIFTPYDWPNRSPWGLRATGSFANPDHLAGYLGLLLPLAVAGVILPAVVVSRRYFAARLFCGSACILVGSALLLTSSRGGWLGSLAGLLVLAALWPRARVNGTFQQHVGPVSSVLVGALACSVLLFVGPAGRRQIDTRLAETVTQTSLEDRVQVAASSLRIVRDFPLFGLGLGAWPEVYPRYARPPWSPIFWNAAHNDYVQFTSDAGLLGLGLSSWFVATAAWSVRRGKQSLSYQASARVSACIAGLGAAAVHEFLDFPLQIPANALLFTILLALTVRMTSAPYSWQVAMDGWKPRVACALGLFLMICLTSIAIAQEQVPYPYNLKAATIDNANSLIDSHPASAGAHLMLVRAMGEAAPISRRLGELETAIWLEPTDPGARDLYAQTLLQANDQKSAIRQISQSVFYSPAIASHSYLSPRVIPWLSPAMQKAVENGFSAAVAHNYDGAVQNFARYYAVLQDYNHEAAVYDQAANRAHAPSLRAQYFIDAGIACADAGRLADAEAALRAGIAALPENSAGYEQLMLRVFAPERNLQAARIATAQGISHGADPVRLYLALASSAQASGNIDEAERAAQAALLLRPSNFEALMQIGILDLSNNRFERASMWLQKAAQINPSSLEAAYDLGLAAEKDYDYFAADRAYRRALSLAPADPSIRSHYLAFRQKLADSHSGTPSP